MEAAGSWHENFVADDVEPDHHGPLSIVEVTVHRGSHIDPQFDDRPVVLGCLQPVQAAHRVIFSPLRVSVEEWYHGVYQALPIRKEIDREGIAVELPAA